MKRLRLFGRPASQFSEGYSGLSALPSPIPASNNYIDSTITPSSTFTKNASSSSQSVPKLPAVSLNPSSFARYGSVVQSYPDARCAPKSIPIKTVNFGTAQKYNFLSPTASPVALPSKWASQGVEQKLNMCTFRCEPQNTIGGRAGSWEVRVLERHEFSSQTFMPMGSENGSYLVLVALPGEGEIVSFLVLSSPLLTARLLVQTVYPTFLPYEPSSLPLPKVSLTTRMSGITLWSLSERKRWTLVASCGKLASESWIAKFGKVPKVLPLLL